MLLRRGVCCTNSLATSLVVIEPTFTPPDPGADTTTGAAGEGGAVTTAAGVTGPVRGTTPHTTSRTPASPSARCAS